MRQGRGRVRLWPEVSMGQKEPENKKVQTRGAKDWILGRDEEA